MKFIALSDTSHGKKKRLRKKFITIIDAVHLDTLARRTEIYRQLSNGYWKYIVYWLNPIENIKKLYTRIIPKTGERVQHGNVTKACSLILPSWNPKGYNYLHGSNLSHYVNSMVNEHWKKREKVWEVPIIFKSCNISSIFAVIRFFHRK